MATRKKPDLSGIFGDAVKQEPAKPAKAVREKTEKVSEQSVKPKRTGRPKRADADDFQRATFIVRKTYLEQLTEYAEAHRMTIKNALDLALEEFFSKH